MAVNYNDERFQSVNEEKQAALNNINNTYNDMINKSDSFYNDLSNQIETNANVQKEIQQQNTDFAIDKIEQQKEWLNKDYQKEQKGAYVDYQKQINPYGAEAEKIAQMGLANSGYSESSRVSMFNTYQNRVATARDSFNKAIQNYDNGIREAQLSNNAKLAEITAQAQAKSLELALQGFQYKNSLLQTQLNAQQTTEDRYYSRWQDVLKQINTENALAEEKRQFNAQLSLSKKQAQILKNNNNDSIDKNGNPKYSDTGFVLGNFNIYKSGNNYYIKQPNGNYAALPIPVAMETKNTLTLSNGQVLGK